MPDKMFPESPDLNTINLSVVFTDNDQTSSLEPSIDENIIHPVTLACQELPNLNAINFSAAFSINDPTSSFQPSINENTITCSQIDSWGYGTAGRPERTEKRNTYSSQPVGSDGAYCGRDGFTRCPCGQRDQNTVYEQVLDSYSTGSTSQTCPLCLPRLLTEKNSAVAQQTLCKQHRQPRAQQDRYGQ
ncbi:uncharacterized protein FMAN_11009 [Fusarium mangiferae]|uniref:Uncharacterized protein n=1 Tax=Fusarium mangiferae TaxID=192010 RepID=A0A1L7TFG9_FUSMA|nr:uncharacterized protein FMAN_11009 [Fusarium mangiferae]CVK96679.1 uncharacterized protein FMAN_11009 [Fusarium mangiferae]